MEPRQRLHLNFVACRGRTATTSASPEPDSQQPKGTDLEPESRDYSHRRQRRRHWEKPDSCPQLQCR